MSLRGSRLNIADEAIYFFLTNSFLSGQMVFSTPKRKLSVARVKFLAITILLMMVSLTGISRAQEFDELKGFYGKEIKLSFADPDTDSITTSVNTPAPKSHVVPLVMDLIPLGILGGVGGYCSTVPYGDWDDPHRGRCVGILHLSGGILMSFGTVPSHVYIKSKWYMTLGLSAIKASFYFIFSVVGFAADFGHNYGGDYDGGAALFKYGTIPALAGTFIVYGYEMIDHQLTVKKFNEDLEKKNQKTQTMITPLIWKDRVGLALQMSF